MTLVAANIAAAMERQKTNCAEVARRAGTGPTSVYDIVSGKSKNPRLDTLRKIAEQGLGVPLIALFVPEEEAELDQEILQVFARMPLERRRDLLALAQALLSQTPSR